MDNVCYAYLISGASSPDELRQYRRTEVKRKVIVTVSSASLSEWTNAGIVGLKPEFRCLIFAWDYEGENEIEIDGKRYSIYRTYQNGQSVELYLTVNAGDEG